jgi:hypothetical protein
VSTSSKRPTRKQPNRIKSLSESSESSPQSPLKKSRLHTAAPTVTKKPEHPEQSTNFKSPIVLQVKAKARPEPNNSIMDSTINFYNTMFLSHSLSSQTSMRVNESSLHLNESTSSIRVRAVSARKAATTRNRESNLQNLLMNMSSSRR